MRNVFRRASHTESGVVWGPVRNSASGRVVNDKEALKVSAVFACIRILSQSIASLPLILYKRTEEGGKQRSVENPLYWVLHDQPNQIQSSFDFFEYVVGSLCLRGNSYVQRILNGAGQVSELWPLPTEAVTVKITPTGEKYYVYSRNGVQKVFGADEIIHFKGLSSDGLVGLSPIDSARESIGVALATEEHSARFFSEGVSPTGVLEHPGVLTDAAAKRIRDSFQERYAGSGNSGKTMLLEENMKWHQVGLTNEQSQFLETRKFQTTEIARWFGVPPHMIGDLERATFSNIEHQALEFVTFSLRPWLVRIERTLINALFTAEDRRKYVLEFLVDALLRGDIKTRYEAYQIARNNGWLNVDEIRQKENMNPLPDQIGQKYLQQLNMTELGKEPDPAKEGTPAKTRAKKDPEEVDRAFRGLLSESLPRYVRRARKDSAPALFEHVNETVQGIVRCFFTSKGREDADVLALRVTNGFVDEWIGQRDASGSEETEEQETLRRVERLMELCGKEITIEN